MKHRHGLLIASLAGIALAAALTLAAWGGAESQAAPLETILYVDASATGDNKGTSWQHAYTELQLGLTAALSGTEIWVATGVYTPTEPHGGEGERYRSFQLKNGVALYGGFAGTETGRDQRDWQIHQTVLSGDIGIPGDPSDNSYHVFYHPSELALDRTAILDGFSITGGNADGAQDPDAFGGGMYNNASSPALTHCTFSDNWAKDGGGMFNDISSSPTLDDCTFSGNSANFGGGIYNHSSSPVLTDCIFSGNSVSFYGGGGMFNAYASPSLTNCIFAGNSASDGGGMTNFSDSAPVLTNCTFSGNSANFGGGMANFYNSAPVLTNCTFSGNSATEGGGMRNYSVSSPALTNCTFSGNSATEGGGMANYYSSSPTLTNSILWGNTATAAGDQIFNRYSSMPAVSHSDVEGSNGSGGFWNTALGSDGGGNLDLDPRFLAPATGDFHLQPGSPCIDAGDNFASDLPIHDFEGDPRIVDGNVDGTATVDMGVDEFLAFRVFLPLALKNH